MLNKIAIRRDLVDLLTKYNVDKYSGLHNQLMAENIIRWIEDYTRTQYWSTEKQQSYYDYMKQKEDPDGIQSNPRTR